MKNRNRMMPARWVGLPWLPSSSYAAAPKVKRIKVRSQAPHQGEDPPRSRTLTYSILQPPAWGLTHSPHEGSPTLCAIDLHFAPQAALGLARRALHYARQTGDSLRVAKACYLSGMISKELGQHLESFAYYARARQAFAHAGDDKFAQSATWAMGYALYEIGDYNAALALLSPLEETLVPILSATDAIRYYKD